MKRPELKDVNLLKVESSNIDSIAYDNDTRTLFVKFKSNKTYSYQPITYEGFKGLYEADSIGKHFIEHIKDNSTITWERVE